MSEIAMTTMEKFTILRNFLIAREIANIFKIPASTVGGWTKTGYGKRHPSDSDKNKINKLYDKLQPRFENFKWVTNGKQINNLRNEIWKPIMGFEGLYEISNYGMVRRIKIGTSTYTNKMLLNHINTEGYVVFRLYKNGKGKDFKAHRLVAIAFLDNPLKKECVHHINCIKSFNWVENLEWVTRKENTRYAAKECKYNGERSSQSKLKDIEVLEILKLIETTDLRYREISKKFNVSVSTIKSIRAGITWKHISR
jgi:hypothetical protein